MTSPAAECREPRSRRGRLLVVGVLFLALYVPSRLVLLTHFTPIGSDTDLYARYAWIHEKARERGENFYERYRSEGLKDSVLACYTLRDLTEIPYPPLAIRFITMPARFFLNNQDLSDIDEAEFTRLYQRWYRYVCLPFDALIVMLVFWLILGRYPEDRLTDTCMRAGIVTGAGVLLPHLLYDRLDIVLAAILMISAVMLHLKRWMASFALLALALAFKPLPIFCVPLWIVAAMPWDRIANRDGPDALRVAAASAAGRFGVLCLWTVCITGIMLLADGRHSLDFLTFHGSRGIHIESFWGTFTLLFSSLFMHPFSISYDFGAFNVSTSWTSVLTAISSVLTFVLTFVTSLLLFWQAYRNPRPASISMGRIETAAGLIVVFLGITFCTFKMFSPQFLLLLIPLIPLVRFRGIRLLGFCTIFCGACCFSTYIYPYFYMNEIVNGPSAFGLFLLVSRTVLLIALPVTAAISEINQWRISRNRSGLRNFSGHKSPSILL